MGSMPTEGGRRGSTSSSLRVAVIGTGAVTDEITRALARLGAGPVDVVGDDVPDALTLGRLQACDCALIATADPETHLRLNEMCQIVGVDMVALRLEPGDVVVDCFPFHASAPHACLVCNLPAEIQAGVAARYAKSGLRLSQGAGATAPPTVAPGHARVAGSALAELAVAMRDEPASTARRFRVSVADGARKVVALERRDQCPGCAHFTSAPRIVRTRNRWCSREEGIPGDRDHVEQVLRLSDPLITRFECQGCGPLSEAARYVNQRAARFDESIASCPRCGSRDVRLEIRDTFRLAELMQGFAGAPVPARYALAEIAGAPVCFDLESDGPA